MADNCGHVACYLRSCHRWVNRVSGFQQRMMLQRTKSEERRLKEGPSVWALCRTPNMRLKTTLITLNWWGPHRASRPRWSLTGTLIPRLSVLCIAIFSLKVMQSCSSFCNTTRSSQVRQWNGLCRPELLWSGIREQPVHKFSALLCGGNSELSGLLGRHGSMGSAVAFVNLHDPQRRGLHHHSLAARRYANNMDLKWWAAPQYFSLRTFTVLYFWYLIFYAVV